MITDSLCTFSTTVSVEFSLEVTKSSLKLINKTNGLVYEATSPSTDLLNSLMNTPTNFSVKDVFEIDSPILVINSKEINMTRTVSRKELETRLYNYGTRKADMNNLTKKIDLVEKTLTDKVSSIEKSVSRTENQISNLELNVDGNLKLLNKEISLVAEGKLTEISRTEEKGEEGIASKPIRIRTELDEKFESITGTLRYCKGKNNGCTDTGTIWGSNPYTCDDGGHYCMAALHAGIIDMDGGYYTMKLVGSQATYLATNSNGITSSSYGQYNGYSIHSPEVDVDGKNSTSCGAY